MIFLWPKLGKRDHNIFTIAFIIRQGDLINYIVSAAWRINDLCSRLYIPNIKHVVISPARISHDLIYIHAAMRIVSEQSFIILQLNLSFYPTLLDCFIIVELCITKPNSIEHILTNQRIVSIAQQFNSEKNLHEWISESDSFCINPYITWESIKRFTAH